MMLMGLQKRRFRISLYKFCGQKVRHFQPVFEIVKVNCTQNKNKEAYGIGNQKSRGKHGII